MPNADELALADKLRLAAARGQTQVVAQLRKQGAKFDVDRDGRTALHFACQNGHLETVSALLKDNIAVNAADFIGQTALQRAAGEGHREVVKELLRAGADPDKQDELGNCALHEAAWRGYSETVEVLCAAGAKLSQENAAGFVPLHLAAQHGHNQTARMLLLAGCDPDIPNTYGDTALHTSCRYGHAGVTRILVSARCNINIQNKNGDTALHIAAAMGRRKLTRILLEAGAERNLENKQKETPLDIAVRKEAREIADFLTHPPSVLPGPTRGTSRSRRSSNKRANGHHNNNNRSHDRHQQQHRQHQQNNHAGHHDDEVAAAAAVAGARRRHASDSPLDRRSSKEKKRVRHGARSSGRSKHKQPVAAAAASAAGAQPPDSIPWSPYGCHYAPNPKEFPKPKLNSLPPQPLQKGELYFTDLAGNIRKGPIGVGTACYCSPLFRRLESRIDHDRTEITHNLEQTRSKLSQRISALELQTRSQLASLDQRLSLWERMRRQGSPMRPNSPTTHSAMARMDPHSLHVNGVLPRSRSEERLNQTVPDRPSSAGGLSRAKSSYSVEDRARNGIAPTSSERQHQHHQSSAVTGSSPKSYKGLVVREAPVSESGRVLMAAGPSAAGANSKLRHKTLRKTKEGRSNGRLHNGANSPPAANRKQFMHDFDMSSGSESEGDAQDREEEEVEEDKDGSQKLLDRLGLDAPGSGARRDSQDGAVVADNGQYMTMKPKTRTGKLPLSNGNDSGQSNGRNSATDDPNENPRAAGISPGGEPPVKATVNFKPGAADVYQLRHQDHLVTSYLNRIQTNVRTLREKFEKQLVLLPEEQHGDEAKTSPLSPPGVAPAPQHFHHPRMAASPPPPPPPAPGAVQVLPQLCSNSSGSSSSGIGSTSTDQSSAGSLGTIVAAASSSQQSLNGNNSRRLLPQPPPSAVFGGPLANNKAVANSNKDEHNDSGYSITRFHNGSPPISNGQQSNSNSGTPEVPDQDSNYHSSEENSLTPTEEANKRAAKGHQLPPPSWRPAPPATGGVHFWNGHHGHLNNNIGSSSNGLPPLPDYETATVRRLTKDFLKPHMAVPNQVTQPPSRPPPLATSHHGPHALPTSSQQTTSTVAYHFQTYQQRYLQQQKHQHPAAPSQPPMVHKGLTGATHGSLQPHSMPYTRSSLV